MMSPCSKCLENNWKFERAEGIVHATCNLCGYEVEFEAKKNSGSKFKTGDICRKCGGIIVIKETKKRPKQLKKTYYYTAYYYCPKCRTIYYSDRFKVYNSFNQKQCN